MAHLDLRANQRHILGLAPLHISLDGGDYSRSQRRIHFYGSLLCLPRLPGIHQIIDRSSNRHGLIRTLLEFSIGSPFVPRNESWLWDALQGFRDTRQVAPLFRITRLFFSGHGIHNGNARTRILDGVRRRTYSSQGNLRDAARRMVNLNSRLLAVLVADVDV